VKRRLTAFLLLLCSSLIAAGQPAAAGRPAPELTFVLPDVGQRSLSQYKGKVVALEFILTTCVHCQAASKVMTRLQSEYGSKGFQALDLAINGLGEGRDAKAAGALVSQFKNDFQVGFPVGYVEHDKMPAFMGFSLMQRTVVPQLVLIDRDGNIRYETPATGDSQAMQESTLRDRITELLAARMTGGKSKAAGVHKGA
jgi:thiol-disulfide isomerase/thioredoxin